MLELVSLSPTEARRRVRNYSHGMRQRLGIAHALLGDPSVLILDEPANGLDPAGIRWMRDLLRSYAARGGTVLLSSHLLNEVELIADEMVVIGQGRIVAQGDKQALLAMDSDVSALASSLDDEALAAELRQRGFSVGEEGDGVRAGCSTEEVGRAALAAGVVLTDLRTGAAGLEDLFLQLTAETQRDDVAEGAPA
jgi:ABC-2 type transport system ATP-binding protein